MSLLYMEQQWLEIVVRHKLYLYLIWCRVLMHGSYFGKLCCLCEVAEVNERRDLLNFPWI
jgi:hypothetical protein